MTDFKVSDSEIIDLLEATECEIHKHKKEPFHKPYLDRLRKIQTKMKKHMKEIP